MCATLPMIEASCTLATIAIETTSSMRRCEAGLGEALAAAVQTVQARPDADQLLLRVVLFSTDFGGVREVHGFTPVSQLNAEDYRALNTVGMAPLLDAMYESVKTALHYGHGLAEDGQVAHGRVVVITDGYNARSLATPEEVRHLTSSWETIGGLGSFRATLIGLWAVRFREHLVELVDRAGFDQFKLVEEAVDQWVQLLTKHLIVNIVPPEPAAPESELVVLAGS